MHNSLGATHVFVDTPMRGVFWRAIAVPPSQVLRLRGVVTTTAARTRAAADTVHRNGDSEANTGRHARDRWFNGMHAPTPGQHPLVEADLYGTLREKHIRLSPAALTLMYADVRDRTMRAMGGLDEGQLHGEVEASLNPMIWAMGHTAHFYETMVVRLLEPARPIHTPGTLLDGWDVDGAFDSFRVEHGDRFDHDDAGLVQVSPEGTYPEFERMVQEYRDRMTGILCERLANHTSSSSSSSISMICMAEGRCWPQSIREVAVEDGGVIDR